MNNSQSSEILKAFEIYKGVVFTVDSDLRFWQSFLKTAIEEHKKKYSNLDKAYSAIFPVYNINPNTNSGVLKTHKEVYSIRILDLDKHQRDFFIWVMNLSP